MFIEAIIISLILGFIRGGKLKRFRFLNHRTIWIFVLGALIQYMLIFLNKIEELEGLGRILEYNMQLQIISYILILVGLLTNIRFRSLWIILLGYISNLLVIAFNGWERPDMLNELLSEGVKFPFLGGTILFSEPYPIPRIVSLGDLIISFGIFGIIQEVMLGEDSFMGPYRR